MGLASKGHSVTVVTSSRGLRPGVYTETMGPLKVIRYPETRYLLEAPIMPRIALAALREDYDVLHVHGMTPSVTEVAILFAKLRRKRVVLTYHNDAQSTFQGMMGAMAGAIYSKLVIPVIGMVDHVISTTHSYAATSPVLRYLMRAVTVIPWGTDLARPRDGQDEQVKKEQKRVLFVGQLKEYKGVHVLLDSLAKLNGSGHSISIDIVGSGPSSDNLKTMARDLNIAERVRFWGTVSDETLAQFYRDCDVVTLPSVNRREAFGLVLLDAFAAGKRVVATNIPGVKEVALLGDGYLASPNDPYSLSDCILKATLNDATQSERLKQVAEKFSWDKVLVKYDEVLRNTSRGLVPCISFLLTILGLAVLPATGSLALPSILPA